MYLVTLRINTLRDLAQLPEEFEMLECKPDIGGITGPAERWNGSTKVTINSPDVPYTGAHQDAIDNMLEHRAGHSYTYEQVKSMLEQIEGVGNSASQVRATMKNAGLITKE